MGLLRSRSGKRRIFLWVFLAIQVLFLIWMVTGATAGTGSCNGLNAHDCAGAADVGHGVAAALQIILWMIVDVILGITYGVYKLATR